MTDIVLRANALNAEAFAPFGDVIEVEGRRPRWINQGTCRRFDDLASIDVAQAGGRPALSIFEAEPRRLPLEIRMLERHPLSSQAFIPLQPQSFLVVVAESEAAAVVGDLQVFMSFGHQGINYRRSTWHHPLIALEHVSRFLVVDRAGPGVNCDELVLDARILLKT